MRHSTGRPTKADIARWQRFPEIGCVACIRAGVPVPNPLTDVHHLLSGNRRRGHQQTIPLCFWHHRGQPLRFGVQATRELMGPSLAHGSKPFREAFGTDDELLEFTNKLLESSYEVGDVPGSDR